jgi:hypothetical protein
LALLAASIVFLSWNLLGAGVLLKSNLSDAAASIGMKLKSMPASTVKANEFEFEFYMPVPRIEQSFSPIFNFWFLYDVGLTFGFGEPKSSLKRLIEAYMNSLSQY